MSHTPMCRGFDVLLGKSPKSSVNAVSGSFGDDENTLSVKGMFELTAGSLVGGVVTGIFFAKDIRPSAAALGGVLCVPASLLANALRTGDGTFRDETFLATTGLLTGAAMGAIATAAVKECVTMCTKGKR